MGRWPAVLALLCAVNLPGCGRPRNPVPIELIPKAELPGYAGVRGWWEKPEPIKESLREGLREFRRRRETLADAPDNNNPAGQDHRYDILCLSGGGPDGAFGAGLLCGWTESGQRPQFWLVTGISTGAMIAPFAFLGSEYDHVLERLCANVRTRNIYRRRPLTLVAFGASSLADSSPLARLLEESVNDAVVAAVAREHAKGRRLLIGTTNLDAGRLFVWDMGAIAASGRPDAPALFRKLLLASSSIPIAFPPQYFQVRADGRNYDELHVDGGILAEIFLYGVAMDARPLWREVVPPNGPRPRLCLIRNGYLHTPAEATRTGVLSIAERTVVGLLDSKAAGDVYRLHAMAVRDDLDFHLAYLPEDFTVEKKEPFDPQAGALLFEHGRSQARAGYPWFKAPPGLNPSDPHQPLLLGPLFPPEHTAPPRLMSSRGESEQETFEKVIGKQPSPDAMSTPRVGP